MITHRGRNPGFLIAHGGFSNFGGVEMIYFIAQENMEFVKIGYVKTEENISARLSLVQNGNPHKLHLIGTIIGGKPTEAILHRSFREYRRNGEWFAHKGRLKNYIDSDQVDKTPITKRVSPQKEKMSRQRKWQIKRSDNGLCEKCGDPVVEGKKMCQTHLDSDSKRHKKGERR